jgi:adenosylcobinamide-GDP ribazoletransferase
MRDSRIGSYGALALGLALMLRVTALAAILGAAGPWAAAAAILIAAMWSRSQGVVVLATIAPARSDGRAANVGRPQRRSMHVALALSAGGAIGFTLSSALPVWGLCAGLALSVGAVGVLARLARRLIGGQTGDIVGATQQLSEVAIYLGFALLIGTAAA